jgi:enoyl-CoA hydratase
MANDYQFIIYEDRGAVVRLWHNRPDVGNAESPELLDELDDAVRRAEADPKVNVVVLAGKGKHFSAGHDLKRARSSIPVTPETRLNFEERYYYEYCLRILDFKKPTIAQVQGACMAGGFMVANMCDLVVASEDAFFSDPVCVSLGAAAVEVLIHPYVMGMRKAKEFLFTGRRMPAAEALEVGMVNKVVPLADLDRETLALADKIAAAPPFAMKLIKKSLNRVWEAQGIRTVLNAHLDTHQLAHESTFMKERASRGLGATVQAGKSVAAG